LVKVELEEMLEATMMRIGAKIVLLKPKFWCNFPSTYLIILSIWHFLNV